MGGFYNPRNTVFRAFFKLMAPFHLWRKNYGWKQMARRKRRSVTGDGWSATEHRANPANNSATSKDAEPLPVKSNSLPTSVRGEAGRPSG